MLMCYRGFSGQGSNSNGDILIDTISGFSLGWNE